MSLRVISDLQSDSDLGSIRNSCDIYGKVDFFASDTVKKGERREALWSAGNVFACIIRLILNFLEPIIET